MLRNSTFKTSTARKPKRQPHEATTLPEIVDLLKKVYFTRRDTSQNLYASLINSS